MLVCTPAEIKVIHQHLAASFGKQIASLADIAQPPAIRNYGGWERQIFEGVVTFELWPRDLIYAKTSARSAPVVRLRGFDEEIGECAWASWREQWAKNSGEKAFSLRDASFTFYWGEPFHVDEQLFRAEWPMKDVGCKTAAHPHWQFDLSMTGTDRVLDGVHFGMAGWEGAGDNPVCWQRFPKNASELEVWAERTLEYARAQLVELPPRLA